MKLMKDVNKTRNREVLIEVGVETGDWTKLTTAIQRVVRNDGNMHEHVPWVASRPM